MGLLTFIVDRAKEKSTWLGLTGIITALGITLSPEQTQAIAAMGVAIAGLIATFTKEK